MDNRILIGIILVLMFLMWQVPYCVQVEEVEETEQTDAIYTEAEVNVISVQPDIFPILIKGTSMFPTLKENMVCSCSRQENYFVGDTVAFFQKINGEFEGIVHKIIRINGDEIVTKGTNNVIEDQPIKAENILCKIDTIPRWRLLK